jgi:hypothetical protein
MLSNVAMLLLLAFRQVSDPLGPRLARLLKLLDATHNSVKAGDAQSEHKLEIQFLLK